MSDRLNPGDQLFRDQSITSGDGRFRLTMQLDGNLVVYRNVDGRSLLGLKHRSNRCDPRYNAGGRKLCSLPCEWCTGMGVKYCWRSR